MRFPNLEFLRLRDPGTSEILGEAPNNMGDLDIGSVRDKVLVRGNNVQQRRNSHRDWAVEIHGPYFAGYMVPLKAWPLGDRFG